MSRKLLMTALIALGVASSAHAATKATSKSTSSGGRSYVSVTSIGPRGGFSVDPDQVVVGGHVSASIAPQWTFNPSVEIGFGDHATVTALNFDGEYHFRLQNSNWAPYLGGGIGVNFIHVHIDEPFPFSDIDANDTATGLNLIGGTMVPTASGQHLFAEVRLGLGDTAIPELKGIVGWNFKL